MNDGDRRLAAILAADVVSYSAQIGVDDAGTLARVRALRTDVIEPLAANHGGRVFKTAGDGFLLEFPSAVQSLRCAIAIQTALSAQPAGLRLRVGVHQGEVVAEGDDLFGDAVIVAARLEPLAEPGGIVISSRVREDAAGKMALDVDDLGEPPLKNIAARIRAFKVRLLPPAVAAPLMPASPDRPSIAVLPFQNMSGDPEQEYFADGMVEEIITALSRIRWLFVIARNSTFTYKGRAVDVKQAGRELGVRYVLEGSVRKSLDKVRITGQLIDSETGAHLWANRFDGSLADVFELQDQVAISVAAAIEPTLQSAEVRRSTKLSVGDLTQYDLYLRALSHFFEMRRDGLAAALDLLTQGLERDPNYGPSLGLICEVVVYRHANGWVENPDAASHDAIAFARRAIRAGSDDPDILSRAAYALGFFGQDIDAAIDLADRSLVLNPNSADGWRRSGLLRLYAGHSDQAIEHLERSSRLDPRAIHAHQWTGIGRAHFFELRFEAAVTTLMRAIQELPDYVTPRRFLAAALAHLGRMEEAREAIEQLRVITPRIIGIDSVYTKESRLYRKPEHQELLISGLRLAASPPG